MWEIVGQNAEVQSDEDGAMGLVEVEDGLVDEVEVEGRAGVEVEDEVEVEVEDGVVVTSAGPGRSKPLLATFTCH